MLTALRGLWPLFIGLLLLMIGNGLQATLLGIRGSLEGFSATTMSYVMSAYFAGFLLGSRLTPFMIGRVGHVRVFAALASLISAAFILYAAIPNPYVWMVMRLIVGLCLSGVYVVTESWLNASSTNETRGQTLSLYVIVMMSGMIMSQGLVNVADPAGYALFVVMSVLVSVAVAPILLSATPAPVFVATKRMSVLEVYHASPLAMVGTFLLGGIFSALFGMSAVFATEAGLSAVQTSIFVAIIYTGGLVSQYPIGWMSDRMDRRILIFWCTAVGAVGAFAAAPFLGSFAMVCLAGFIIGAMSNPLYSLLLAYINDFLEADDMAAASGGMMFANGVGAIFGPIVIGVLMQNGGPEMFFVFTGGLLAAIAGYAGYRMTRRAAPSVDDTSVYAPVLPQASPVAVEWAQEYAADLALEEEEAAEAETETLSQ